MDESGKSFGVWTKEPKMAKGWCKVAVEFMLNKYYQNVWIHASSYGWGLVTCCLMTLDWIHSNECSLDIKYFKTLCKATYIIFVYHTNYSRYPIWLDVTWLPLRASFKSPIVYLRELLRNKFSYSNVEILIFQFLKQWYV